MYRFALVFAVALLVAVSPAAAQPKAKGKKQAEPAEQPITAESGDRLQVIAPLVVAKDDSAIEELQLSFDAKDREGIASMVEKGKAVRLEPGTTLVLLKVVGPGYVPVGRCECRAIKDGKAIGLYPVNTRFFSTQWLRKLPPPQ